MSALERVPTDELEVVSYGEDRWHRDGEGPQFNGRGKYKFDDLKKAAYLKLIREGVGKVRASEYVGVSYTTVSDHLHRFPEFAKAVSEAQMARIDEVEEALFETAIAGNVVAQQVVLYNRRPEEWADMRAIQARADRELKRAEAESAAEQVDASLTLRERLLELRERLLTDEDLVAERAADAARAETHRVEL